ncbi:MAG: carboxylesterase family protein [Roseiarcus sp.]
MNASGSSSQGRRGRKPPAESGAEPIVTTTGGQVRGLTAPGGYVFRGLPYAVPPVGDLRWEPATLRQAPTSSVPWQNGRTSGCNDHGGQRLPRHHDVATPSCRGRDPECHRCGDLRASCLKKATASRPHHSTGARSIRRSELCRRNPT